MADKGKRINRVNKAILYLFGISVLALFLIIYVYPAVTGALTRTSLVLYGGIRVTDKVTCYFVRDERVIKAGESGKIQYYIEEGEYIRKGTRVLAITPASKNYSATGNCVISYYHDGLETLFTPDAMTALEKESIDALDISIVNMHRDSAIAGEPVFKCVNNDEWYTLFWVSEESIIKYEKGKPIQLSLPLGQVKGNVHDIIDSRDGWLVVLKFNRYYSDLPKLRKIEAEVVTSDYEGLLIANKSITSKDGRTGVYVKDKSGDYLFTPVSVIVSDGEYSLVESTYINEKRNGENIRIPTVDVYDEILNHPERN